jgi:hypothetical protein
MRTDPDGVRARIREVAEEHFRRVGYHKTSVTDIASELDMRRANVYRFFPSRDAINESTAGGSRVLPSDSDRALCSFGFAAALAASKREIRPLAEKGG